MDGNPDTQHPFLERDTLSHCPVLSFHHTEVGITVPISRIKDLKLREILEFLANMARLFLTLDFLLDTVHWNTDKLACSHLAHGTCVLNQQTVVAATSYVAQSLI